MEIAMIKIYELEKDLTDVRDDELGSIVGGQTTVSPSYGYKRDNLTGVNTTNLGLGVNGTQLGYQNNNINGQILSETYSLKQQITPGLTGAINYEGVTKSVTPSVEYKSGPTGISAFAGPGGFGVQASTSFTF
jgi:hypothetical protein